MCGEVNGDRWILLTKASNAERLNKRLNKQWWGWWFKMPSCPLWRHCNVMVWPQQNKQKEPFTCFVVHKVECHYNTYQHITISNAVYAVANIENKSDFEITKDTPWIVIRGKNLRYWFSPGVYILWVKLCHCCAYHRSIIATLDIELGVPQTPHKVEENPTSIGNAETWRRGKCREGLGTATLFLHGAPFTNMY